MTIDTQKLSETLDKAIGRAYSMGQTYWMQADSESYSQNRRADETQAKFDAMRAEVVAKIEAMVDVQAAEIERLRAALEFYANESNWTSMSVMERGPLVDDDGGDKARAALSGEGK